MSRSNSYTDEIREKSNYELNKLIANKDKFAKEKVQASLWELEKRGALDEEGKRLLSRYSFTNSTNFSKDAFSGPLPTGPFMDPNISNDPSLPKLYSRYSVRFFAIFFSTFFGGILISINLFRLKKKDQILPVVLFSFFFAYLTVFLSGKYPEKMTIITLIMNIIGSLLLEELFWNKMIGKDFKFQRQSVLPALLVGGIISLILLLGMSSLV
ncbi:MAG: hypothetical protein K9H49_17180 [Bacteroidales bacterium]|nr:hypothetical protein [Bacteroidales bacterium]MCF8392196.1 hypothetical protein [Bacteroidales bacterium]